jgi:hypothetical protein
MKIKGCRFDPWQGSRCQQGICNRKVLIIGESHHTKARKWHERTFTQNVILLEAIKRHRRRSFRYFTILQKLFGNNDVQSEQGRSWFWNSVMSYNYVQAMMDGSRRSPKADQWNISQRPFLAVVEKLDPDVMIITGKRLWGKLIDGLVIEELRCGGLFLLTLKSGKRVPVVRIMHPSSSAFRYPIEKPKVKALLRRRKKAQS